MSAENRKILGQPSNFWHRSPLQADWFLLRRQWFLLAVIVGLTLRIAVFVYAWYIPIGNEAGVLVSPSILQSSTDFETYIKAAAILDKANLSDFVDAVEQPIRGEDDMFLRNFLQPLLPLLISMSDYAPGQTLFLSLIFLGISCAVLIIWLEVLRRTTLSGFWILLFSLLPTPLWFTINMTLDGLLTISVAVFYFFYFVERDVAGRFIFIGFAAFLMLITRSNGVFIIGFLAADILLSQRLHRIRLIAPLTVLLVTGIMFGFLVYPLYIFELEKTSNMIGLFEIDNNDWLTGIYSTLPTALNLVLTWLSFALAKLAYFCGLRPSFGETTGILLILRAAPALIMLPGFVCLIFVREHRQRLFFLCFFLPFFNHLPQERYSLAVQPILFLFGARLLDAALMRLNIFYADRRGHRGNHAVDRAS